MKLSFQKWVKITLVSIYLVIVAGGIVRMTDSGMGCPDWPKCFGMWVPPTSVDELPANYQEIYSHRGYADTTFNAAHTWTEYINRLVGALSGIIVFVMMLWSFRYWKTDRSKSGLSIVVYLLMVFQAWLGATVVYSVLEPAKITIHMLAALLIVSVMLLLLSRVRQADKILVDSKLKKLMLVGLGLIVIQVILGTQVRQNIDDISNTFNQEQRELWIGNVDWKFYIHRSFSILLGLVGATIAWKGRSIPKFKNYGFLILGLLLVEIFLGVLMNYFDFPKVSQPLHLVVACVLWGVLFYANLIVKKSGAIISPTQ
ncbi:MAG: cytochrome c oxidase assembly protein subunit 15 [Candidatus Azotimanducaceae bacterium]|jgi:cytochrome c oxidase assembly protein subunit 15